MAASGTATFLIIGKLEAKEPPHMERLLTLVKDSLYTPLERVFRLSSAVS